MQVEQVKPNKPSFPWVVFWFCTTIILIFVAAVIALSWHYHKRNSPPYNKKPESLLSIPASSFLLPAPDTNA